MASILRQIIAGPRAKHPESNLDLCYVTPFIIATSGPSGTYPQRAYRNPLDQLVKFLDEKHGNGWCIWEFRAEGTGYPDSEVYGRVRHYPWPDHHPPPFAIVPLVMAGMRKWLKEGEMPEEKGTGGKEETKTKRVVVVHCKAGKGRSGTMACSYLISQCGWKADEALAKFTERRMRPGFGQGVSIPSQLRTVGYVDRWTKGGKKYVDRAVEILEIHTWGLRDGVKVAVEGYIKEGKVIKVFHVFSKKERVVVEGNPPGGGGFTDMLSDMAGYTNEIKTPVDAGGGGRSGISSVEKAQSKMPITKLIDPSESSGSSTPDQIGLEAGGKAVIFKPSAPIIIPTSDINIDFERRNKAGYGLAMVTSVAHFWFNVFFEGNGPEKNGVADDTGVFEIDWERMDGIKGSLRKGTRALDKVAVVWRIHNPEGQQGKVINQPSDDIPIPQMAAADWKGANNETPSLGKDLGLRSETPASAGVSKANSIKSFDGSSNEKEKAELDDNSLGGVKNSGPMGEEDLDVNMEDLPQPQNKAPEPDLPAANKGLDTASSSTPFHRKEN